MQTTNFNETGQGTIAITYTDPYDLPMLAKMIAEYHSGVLVWEVVISVGCPGNWVYGPVSICFDFDNKTWLSGMGDTPWQLESGEMDVLGQGDLTIIDQKSIYNVLREVGIK